MCSPARSTFLTGYFPAQHGVKYTLESACRPPQYPQVELSTDFKNPASVTAAAGYTPVYKGKFHCVKPANGSTWQPSDVNQYGFTRWDPPDAGANQSAAGGGRRLLRQRRPLHHLPGNASRPGPRERSSISSSAAAQDQPFFMVVSLVNPHDVLSYPKNLTANGYDDSWLLGDIGLPATFNEDLSTKPTVQEQFLRLSGALGPLPTPQMKRNYINFYGNLMKSSDAYLMKILDTLDVAGLLENTLVIATADHGEMGTAHGGMRQKNFNFYEETTRVPLVYSNPRMFRRGRTDHSLVSHVDFLPTLASLVGAPSSARTSWQGVDYSDRILGRGSKPPQDYTVFTYDDYQSGSGERPVPDTAEPRGQYPGASVQARPLLRRRGKRARPVGDV